MCRYGLLGAIVPDNGTKFASAMVTDFCKYLGLQMKFISVVYLQSNSQVESGNKVILKGLKKKLNGAKGMRTNLLHEILWSYYTTPYSTTKETSFSMVHMADAMLHMEIETPSWQRSQFKEEVNEIDVKCITDLIDEVREVV